MRWAFPVARHAARDVVSEGYPERGWNARMTDMQAALWLGQLDRSMRSWQSVAAWQSATRSRSVAHPHVTASYEPDYAEQTWQSYTVQFSTPTPGTLERPNPAPASTTGSQSP